MKKSFGIIVGLFAVMLVLLRTVPAHAETATAATKPWHVTNLKLESQPLCDPKSPTWFFKMSWKPITHQGQPWPKYFVAGYKCTGSQYSCTAERCTAEISGCSTRLSGTWVGVTADIGVKVSGMRLGGIFRPSGCN
jgi:hypothetical protein